MMEKWDGLENLSENRGVVAAWRETINLTQGRHDAPQDQNRHATKPKNAVHDILGGFY
jgi:hypothetical protein